MTVQPPGHAFEDEDDDNDSDVDTSDSDEDDDAVDLDDDDDDKVSVKDDEKDIEPFRIAPPMGRDRLWALLPASVVVPQRLEPEARLFHHTTHPEWGVGLWVKEERSRRRLRFEDGEQRAFKKGYYHFLRPVDPANVDIDEVFDAIQGEHRVAQAEQIDNASHVAKPPVMSFDEQLAVFRKLYPGGFSDPSYVDVYRRPEGSTRRKTQVEPAIAQAAELLTHERITSRLTEGAATEVYEDAMAILTATALVKPAGVNAFAGIAPEHHEAFTVALDDLLYGDGRTRERLSRWLAFLRLTCGLDPSWPEVVALFALVHPTTEAMIEPRALSLQARELRPDIGVGTSPTTRDYREGRRLVVSMRDRLVDAGLTPADLLDVHLFVWETLRPKGQAQARALRGEE